MRLRAELEIEIDAEDFVQAADHQRRVEDLIQVLQADYPQATFEVRERRGRSLSPASQPSRLD
jgi:hypothetical protein